MGMSHSSKMYVSMRGKLVFFDAITSCQSYNMLRPQDGLNHPMCWNEPHIRAPLYPIALWKHLHYQHPLSQLGRWPAKNSYGDPVEKRTVVTPDRRYDPELVPPEWSQWLKMTRQEPPTEEEIAR